MGAKPYVVDGNVDLNEETRLAIKPEQKNGQQKQAMRFNEGKPQWSLIDFDCFEPLVRVMEYGMNKYKRSNWKIGRSINQQCECLLRHCFELMSGKDYDHESQQLIIGHIQANAMMIAHTLKHHPEFDDREKPEPSQCYISGAISSLDPDIRVAQQLAYPIFEKAEEAVIKLGYVPINPMKSEHLAKGHKWIDYMEKDIPQIAECKAIYMLKNWEESTGGRIEKCIVESYAKKLNLKIHYEQAKQNPAQRDRN